MTTNDDLALGTFVGQRFRVQERIGSGAFARVYRAIDNEGSELALKVLFSDEPTAGIRFDREIRVLQSLPVSSAFTRYIADGFTADGRRYLALELVQGSTLAECLARAPVLEPKKATAFVVELCRAFAELHRLGLAHRDVKPDNIILSRQGGIKLIDFGLIRDAQGILQLLESEDESEEAPLFMYELDLHTLAGTPEYMAPEQFTDADAVDRMAMQTDTWSDVFALGVVFYQLLEGRVPFPFRKQNGEHISQAKLRYERQRQEMTDDGLPLAQNATPELWSILRKALRQDPRRRQSDARSLKNDCLRYLYTGQGVLSEDSFNTMVSNDPILAIADAETKKLAVVRELEAETKKLAAIRFPDETTSVDAPARKHDNSNPTIEDEPPTITEVSPLPEASSEEITEVEPIDPSSNEELEPDRTLDSPPAPRRRARSSWPEAPTILDLAPQGLADVETAPTSSTLSTSSDFLEETTTRDDDFTPMTPHGDSADEDESSS